MQGHRTETVMFIFVILGLLVCTEARGISAGTVFVLKGEHLYLHFTQAVVLEGLESLTWRFHESNIVKFGSKIKKVFVNYAERLELAVNNYSVKLNSLNEADSGVYTAVLERDSTEVLTEYNVKVQDRASLPLLAVSSVSESASSCSFTATCSSQDSHINSTFSCDTGTCSQEGGERTEGIPDTFLQVHQSSGSIICNHSNHVSWTNATIIIKDVCHQHDDPEGLSVCLVKTCVFSVGLIIMVSAVITVHLMEKLNENK